MVPLLGPKFLALMDYMHMRALFNTKDTMHKVIKPSELAEQLQKRLVLHEQSREQFKEALESFYEIQGGAVGGLGGDGGSFNDTIPDGGKCRSYSCCHMIDSDFLA